MGTSVTAAVSKQTCPIGVSQPSTVASAMSQSPQQPSIILPVLALVCVVVCWPIGLILAIISIVKYSDATGSSAKTLSIVALAGNLLLVPVIGILAAIAVPSFVKYQCRAKQSEAKSNLRALYVAQETFRADHDTYDADLTKISFSPYGAKKRYRYLVDAATATHFHAVATVDPQYVGELATDRWEIDETNAVTNVSDGCK